MKSIIYALLFLLGFPSCEKIVMNPVPETDNLSLFNEYAKICIEKFGLQEVKEIDLVALADSIRPYITPNLSKEELFNYMGLFVARMQEGHTNLQSLDSKFNANYWYFTGYPLGLNYSIIEKYYYGEEANPEVQVIAPDDSFFDLKYGFLTQNKDIGYIRITTFLMTVSDDELRNMMNYLKDAKGIIIDVRSNLGGYIEFAARLAAYFASEEVVFGTNYIKNGPGPNDFYPSLMRLSPPSGAEIFNKPVAVLHDRVTFSSGSLFALMMSALPNTTTIGIIYGGGTGEISDGFLSNGWKYQISTSNLVDLKGRPTDPGIEADIPMVINPEDSIKDAIIERAILELQ